MPTGDYMFHIVQLHSEVVRMDSITSCSGHTRTSFFTSRDEEVWLITTDLAFPLNEHLQSGSLTGIGFPDLICRGSLAAVAQSGYNNKIIPMSTMSSSNPDVYTYHS